MHEKEYLCIYILLFSNKISTFAPQSQKRCRKHTAATYRPVCSHTQYQTQTNVAQSTSRNKETRHKTSKVKKEL